MPAQLPTHVARGYWHKPSSGQPRASHGVCDLTLLVRMHRLKQRECVRTCRDACLVPQQVCIKEVLDTYKCQGLQLITFWPALCMRSWVFTSVLHDNMINLSRKIHNLITGAGKETSRQMFVQLINFPPIVYIFIDCTKCIP